MKTGAQIGLAVTAGYVLGRFHKMKWALALAAMGARKRLGGTQGELLRQGTKLLGSPPELSKLTEDMRGRLVEAGKAAAVASVTKRIDSLSDNLRERSDVLRTVGSATAAGNTTADDEGPVDEADQQSPDPVDEADELRDTKGDGADNSRPARQADSSRSRQSPAEREGTQRPRGGSRDSAASSRPRTRAESPGQESPSRTRRHGGSGEAESEAAVPRDNRRAPDGRPHSGRSAISRTQGGRR